MAPLLSLQPHIVVWCVGTFMRGGQYPVAGSPALSVFVVGTSTGPHCREQRSLRARGGLEDRNSGGAEVAERRGRLVPQPRHTDVLV